ncbi:MAG: hypothetical protein AB7T31_16785 [Gemmatimonadales bacterium]
MRASSGAGGDDVADLPRSASGTVVAEFRDRASLNRAVRELTGNSVPVDSVQVFVRSSDGRRREIPVEGEPGVLRGALIGAGVGAALGVLLVGLVLAGAFGEAGVSVLGLRGIVGAVRTILLTAAAAVPLGALLGMGRWRSSGKISDEEIERGSAEVVVTSEALEPRARQILHRAGAVRISGR